MGMWSLTAAYDSRPQPTGVAPLFDAGATPGSVVLSNGNATPTLSWNHTLGASGAVLVAINNLNDGAGNTFSATCGGVAMTQLSTSTTNPARANLVVFGLAGVGSGAKTIVVTQSNPAATWGYWYALSTSYKNVFSIGATTTTTNVGSQTITADTTGKLLVCNAARWAGTVTISPGQTTRFSGDANLETAAANQAGGSTPKTFTFASSAVGSAVTILNG